MKNPRGVRGILAFATLGVVVYFIIRVLSRYPGLLNYRSLPEEAKNENSNVLIIAHERSGSSFLGQIFNSHPDVFYVYEPLHALDVTTMRHTEFNGQSTMHLLHDIFACTFYKQTEFLAFMSRMQFNRFSSRALSVPFCENATDLRNRTFLRCKDLEPGIMSLTCARHNHKVVKALTHRLPSLNVDTFVPLLNSDNELKIVHLIRDPRAVVASMERVGWPGHHSAFATATTNISFFKNLVRNFCYNMVQAIRFAFEAEEKLRSRYKMLRFEDLIASPNEVTKHLFEFAGIIFRERVGTYLEKSTNAHDRRNSLEYSTFRENISSSKDHWKSRLSTKALRIVESHCWPMLETLRYTPLFSYTLLNATRQGEAL